MAPVTKISRKRKSKVELLDEVEVISDQEDETANVCGNVSGSVNTAVRFPYP